MQAVKDYPRPREHVLTQTSGDMLVLLDGRGGEYFSLDEVGSRVWALCDGTRSRDDIVRQLCAEYDIDERTMRADLDELLDDLTDAKLLTSGD